MAKTSNNGCCPVFRLIGGFLRRILRRKKGKKVSHGNSLVVSFPPELTLNTLVQEPLYIEANDELSAVVQGERELDGGIEILEIDQDYVIIELERINIKSMFLVNENGRNDEKSPANTEVNE